MGNMQHTDSSHHKTSENPQNVHTKSSTETKGEPTKPLVNITIDEPSELVNMDILTKFYELSPPESRTENFILMYSSKKHGLNINFFHERIVGRGPCFLLIRPTKSSHVFGCFASKSWQQEPDFYGDSSCFLFSFDTKLYVYRPGNYNSNFQYFNHGSKYNKFNGLGIGGRIGYFSLSLNDDLNKGKSNPETMTFPTSPSLCHPSSCTETPIMEGVDVNFEVDLIEVIGWALTKQDRVALEYAKQMREAKRDDEDEEITKEILTQGGVRKDENRGGVF